MSNSPTLSERLREAQRYPGGGYRRFRALIPEILQALDDNERLKLEVARLTRELAAWTANEDEP